jgi:hypothetical protein
MRLTATPEGNLDVGQVDTGLTIDNAQHGWSRPPGVDGQFIILRHESVRVFHPGGPPVDHEVEDLEFIAGGALDAPLSFLDQNLFDSPAIPGTGPQAKRTVFSGVLFLEFVEHDQRSQKPRFRGRPPGGSILGGE